MSAREFTNRLVGAVFGVLLLASTFAAGEARGQAAVTYDLAETYFRQALAKSPSFYEKAAENLEYLEEVKRSASSAGAQG